MRWFRKRRVFRLFVSKDFVTSSTTYTGHGTSVQDHHHHIDVPDGVRGEYVYDDSAFRVYDAAGKVVADFADSDVNGWALVDA